MKGRFHYFLKVADQADAERVATFVAAQYADFVQYETPDDPNKGPVIGPGETSLEVRGIVRFEALDSGQSTLDRVVAAWNLNNSTARAILAGSKVGSHICFNDEDPPVPCEMTWVVK